MRSVNQERAQVQNFLIRGKLARMGVLCEERRTSESLEDENRRLREQLRWYLDILRRTGRDTEDRSFHP